MTSMLLAGGREVVNDPAVTEMATSLMARVQSREKILTHDDWVSPSVRIGVVIYACI